MKYVSDDGNVFTNEQECLAYENKIKKKKDEEAKAIKMINEEIKKIKDQIKEYQNKIMECNREYWMLLGSYNDNSESVIKHVVKEPCVMKVYSTINREELQLSVTEKEQLYNDILDQVSNLVTKRFKLYR